MATLPISLRPFLLCPSLIPNTQTLQQYVDLGYLPSLLTFLELDFLL